MLINRYCKAEYLKFKHSFYKKLLIIIPLFFVLISYLCVANKEHDAQIYFEALTFNWWTVFCLHFSFIISCIMSDMIDKKDHKYDLMKSKGVDLVYVLICKIIITSMFTLILSCFYLLFFWIINIVQYGQIINVGSEITGILLPWLSGIWIIPFTLFLSYCFSWILSLILGSCGMILGVIFTPRVYWYLIPWSYPTRALCPIIKIFPNGLFITNENDILLDPSATIWCVILSLIIYLLIPLIASIYLKHRKE